MVCDILWSQVQGYSPALRGALRSGAYGSVLQAAGEEVRGVVYQVLPTLGSYGPS